jgi:hypothetical protein
MATDMLSSFTKSMSSTFDVLPFSDTSAYKMSGMQYTNKITLMGTYNPWFAVILNTTGALPTGSYLQQWFSVEVPEAAGTYESMSCMYKLPSSTGTASGSIKNYLGDKSLMNENVGSKLPHLKDLEVDGPWATAPEDTFGKAAYAYVKGGFEGEDGVKLNIANCGAWISFTKDREFAEGAVQWKLGFSAKATAGYRLWSSKGSLTGTDNKKAEKADAFEIKVDGASTVIASLSAVAVAVATLAF